MTPIGGVLNIQPETNRRRCVLNMFTRRNTCIYLHVQALRDRITNIRSAQSESSLSKHGATTELEDILHARTELGCIIADLELAGEQGQSQRAIAQQELHSVQTRIENAEIELSEVVPKWEGRLRAEKEERAQYVARKTIFFTRYNLLRSCDRAQAQLEELYAKQGRISRLKSQTARDAYLNKEIAAIDTYEASQAEQISALRVEYEGTVGRAKEYAVKARETDQSVEDRGVVLQTLTAEISELKKSHVALMEQRKYAYILGCNTHSCSRSSVVQRDVEGRQSYSNSATMLRNSFEPLSAISPAPWIKCV